MGRQGNPRVDCDATVERHFEQIRLHREEYLSNALKSPLTASARQRVIQAALRYLESRTTQSLPSQSLSQSVLTQGPTIATGPLCSFQSLLSSLLTDDLPAETLIEACVKAADKYFLPVLEKCLSLLAKVGPILDKKSVALDTQTQQDENRSLEMENNENLNPQILPSDQSGGTPSRSKVMVRRTGQSFVDEFVCKLVENAVTSTGTQSRSNSIFVVSVAREAPLSDHANQVVFSHLTKNMRRVDLVELPAYIYQLLLYVSSRGNSQVKSGVLLQIAQVFSSHEEKLTHRHALSQSILAEDEDAIVPSSPSITDLRQIQGTALLHIEYAVKQDPSLAIEIVRLTKAGVESRDHFLTAFGTGIVLSLARAVSTRTDVLQILRDVISRFDKERVLRKNSLFMARVSMNDRQMVDPSKSLLHIAKCTCENGWDYVKESLLKFAFVLLDKPLPVYSPDVLPLSERVVDQIFLELFKAHPAMRSSILDQLTTRIALQEKSALQSISVLDMLARQIPFFVLEHIRYIRDGIEVLITLPPWLARGLMQAYSPLLTTRQDLYDYFQLVARKSLFHRNVSSRAVSIMAFLTLVSMSKIYRPTKRSSRDIESQSQRRVRAHDKEIDAIMESFQPLRRVFSYPAALKAFMYMNATQYLRDIDSEGVAQNVATVMSEVFVIHLRRFVDAAKAPYLLLDHCVDIKGLVEPLGDLIWCLALIETRKCRTTYKKSYILDIAKKIAGVSVQDFGITKEVVMQTQNDKEDFSNGQEMDDNSPKVLRNKVRVLGSVCEALIYAVLIIPKQQQEWSLFSKIVTPLLALRKQVVEILSHAGAATASDAFIELGGMAALERLRPGMRLMLQRNAKSIHSGKKSASRKSKAGDTQSLAQGAPSPSSKVGLFSILASTASKPFLPLNVSIRILQQMTDVKVEHSFQDNMFKGKENMKELEELRVYLLSITKKHIDDFVSTALKHSKGVTKSREQPFDDMMTSVNTFLRIVMKDFEKYRESPPTIPGQGGLNALQAAESCAIALELAVRYEPKCLSDFCKALSPVTSEFDMRDETTLYETAAELLEELVDALIDENKMKETTTCLRIRSILVDTISSSLDGIEPKSIFLMKRIQWSVDALSRKEIGDSRVVKTIVKSCLLYTENNNDMKRAGELCVRLLLVLGDCDANAEPPDLNESSFADPKLVGAVAIGKDTCFAFVEGVLESADKAILETEWCLSRMTSLETAASESDVLDLESSKNDSSGTKTIKREELAKQAIRAEDAALLRLESVVRTLRGLATCAIGKWSLQERLLKLVTRTYKVMSIATNSQAKRKGDPRTSFISLINEVKSLAPVLWTYLAFMGAGPTSDTQRKKSGRAASEARVMPQLIYEVEKFEKVLINAQKRTKISLLRGMRRNIARDFRIREDVLDEADEEGENEVADDEDIRETGNKEELFKFQSQILYKRLFCRDHESAHLVGFRSTPLEKKECSQTVTVDDLEMHGKHLFSATTDSESRVKSNKSRCQWHSGRRFRKAIRYFSGQDVSFVFVLTLILVFVHFQNRILRTSATAHAFSPTVSWKGNNLNLSSNRDGRREPPSYLPLTQHLKSLKPRKSSLQDMAYGSHKASLRDLRPTDINDIKECRACKENANRVLGWRNPSLPEADLARTLVQLITFYGIKSMVTFPCASETLWIFTFVETMKKINPNFMHYCGIESDESVVGMMKSYNQSDLGETEFIVYSPSARGSLPQVDLMFTWQRLENYNFDTLLAFFKHVESTGIRYTIIKNNPGVENAIMIESPRETYSVVRAPVHGLNFRGFPFGFGEAKRVIPLYGSQLLFYNTSELRDKW
ncbi:unnamed protein product [Agarophyton chilense]